MQKSSLFRLICRESGSDDLELSKCTCIAGTKSGGLVSDLVSDECDTPQQCMVYSRHRPCEREEPLSCYLFEEHVGLESCCFRFRLHLCLPVLACIQKLGARGVRVGEKRRAAHEARAWKRGRSAASGVPPTPVTRCRSRQTCLTADSRPEFIMPSGD